MSTEMPADETAIGLAYAVSGFALLSVGDAVVKSMAADWPAFAVAALRFSFGAIGLSAILWKAEGAQAFVPTHVWLQVARGACLACASLAFFSAIYIMPLAEAQAIGFLAPVLTQVLSRPLLGERVRASVYAVSLVALSGTAIILRPNLAELGLGALLPLVSATFVALLVITNRASAGQGSALSMQVFVAGFCAPILIVAATAAQLSGLPEFDYGWPEWHVVVRCAVVAITASCAHWLVYLGTSKAGASTIAPAIYVQMLVVILMGWWWFGNVPDGYTLLGAVLIIASGLYLWRSGRQQGPVRPHKTQG